MVSESITLAFELEALRYLQQPRSVIISMRQCAQYVGIIATDQDAAQAFGTHHCVRMDFMCAIDATDTFGELNNIRTYFETNRHVLIGVSPQDIFGGLPGGWDHLTVEMAARKTGWLLDTDTIPSDRWIRQQIRRFCR